VTHIRHLADFDLSFLEEIVEVLDTRLDVLDEEIEEHPDPDGWGLLDRFEYMVGLGFLTCQIYLTEVIGDRRDADQCRKLGPRHHGGRAYAEIVHAAGNYVKHKAERQRPVCW
jgi:hypothetical protein